MASSDNLATIEPWILRSTIGDPWISDAFARETETALTKALQQSLYQHSDVVSPISPFLIKSSGGGCSTTAESASGSEPETPGSKRTVGFSSGKITKRKSRASKRSTTTFIQADPANFRQMVQQVTGVKFGNGQMITGCSPVVRPEPLRQPFVQRLQGCLPTLDTSAYLLDYQTNNNNQQHQQTVVSGSTSTGLSQPPATTAVDDGCGSGYDFESLSSFPTLESWN